MDIGLVAILDAPKPSGMGMHGVLLNGPSGLVTGGLRVNRPVSTSEYRDLIDGGHVLPVEGEIPGQLLGDEVAESGVLWVGSEFAERAEGLGLAAPVPPLQGSVPQKDGQFWFDFPSVLFETTQHWLKNGLRHLVARDGSGLDRLMLRVDATSDFTRAAVMHTSDDVDRDLRWFLRLDADAGIQTTAVAIKQRLESLVQAATQKDGLVIALVAHGRHGSYKVGLDIADTSGVEFCAFRAYFRDEADRLFNRHDRESMVRAGEIVTAFRSAEAIVETAFFSGLRPSVSGVPSAVLDGLRHRHILDSLRKVPIVDVRTASVTLPTQPATPDIEESMTPDEVERAETEVEALAREAQFELPRDLVHVASALASA